MTYHLIFYLRPRLFFELSIRNWWIQRRLGRFNMLFEIYYITLHLHLIQRVTCREPGSDERVKNQHMQSYSRNIVARLTYRASPDKAERPPTVHPLKALKHNWQLAIISVETTVGNHRDFLRLLSPASPISDRAQHCSATCRFHALIPSQKWRPLMELRICTIPPAMTSSRPRLNSLK